MPSETANRPILIVTGAAGFLGTNLRNRLGREFRLLSIDLRPVSDLHPGEEFLLCDLGDAEAIRKLEITHGAKFKQAAGLIHFAAYYDFSNVTNVKYERLLNGLKPLVDVFSKNAPASAPFIFASSMAALAPCKPGERLNARSPKFAGWAYPRFKVGCEAILDGLEIPQPIVQLVTAGVYSEWAELVPLFHLMEAIGQSALERTFYPANPDRGLTYVHVDDLVEAYTRALRKYTGASGHCRLLVGESRPTTFRQIRDAVLGAKFKETWPLIRLPRSAVWLGAYCLNQKSRLTSTRRFIQPWMVKFAGEHFEFDVSETSQTLDWKPTHYLGDDLKSMIERANQFPEKWLALNHARPW